MILKVTPFVVCLIMLILRQGCARKHVATNRDIFLASPVIHTTPLQAGKPFRESSAPSDPPIAPSQQTALKTPQNGAPTPYPMGKHPVFYHPYLIGGVHDGVLTDFSLSEITDVSIYNCLLSATLF